MDCVVNFTDWFSSKTGSFHSKFNPSFWVLQPICYSKLHFDRQFSVIPQKLLDSSHSSRIGCISYGKIYSIFWNNLLLVSSQPTKHIIYLNFIIVIICFSSFSVIWHCSWKPDAIMEWCQSAGISQKCHWQFVKSNGCYYEYFFRLHCQDYQYLNLDHYQGFVYFNNRIIFQNGTWLKLLIDTCDKFKWECIHCFLFGFSTLTYSIDPALRFQHL